MSNVRDNQSQNPSQSSLNESTDRVVVVQTNTRSRIAQNITIGPHTLISDEPAPVGDDTGPTPHQLLAGALGACTSSTLTLYARRKEWPLESVSVILKHARIDASDCDGCSTKEGKVDHIERAIQLGGPLSSEQRTRLLEIAEKCPVRRTLESEIHIESRLV